MRRATGRSGRAGRGHRFCLASCCAGRAFEAKGLHAARFQQAVQLPGCLADHRNLPVRQTFDQSARRFVAIAARQRLKQRSVTGFGLAQIGGMPVARFKFGGSGGICQRIVQPAELVDKPVLPRGSAIPHPALTDCVDLLHRLAARCADQFEEAGIEALSIALDQRRYVWREAARKVWLARQRRGGNAIGAHPPFGQRALETGDHREYAD